MPGLQPPGNLLWRPLVRKLSGNQFAQSWAECQPAGLGTARAIQCPFFSPGRAIGTAPTVAGNFTADRRNGSLQIPAKLPERETFNETTRYLLSLRQVERSGFAGSWRRRKTTFRHDNAEHRRRMLAQGPPDITQRFASLPASPEFGLLFMRQAWATSSCHRRSFRNISNQRCCPDRLNPPPPFSRAR